MAKGGSSSSESSSTSTTSTSNYDQRVGAEGGGVALGQGATLQTTDQFSDNVAKAFNQLVNLATDAGRLVMESNAGLQRTTEDVLAANTETTRSATDASAKAMQAALDANAKAMQAALDKVDTQGQRSTDISKSTIDAVTKQLDRQQTGSSTIYTDIFPYVAAAILGIVAIFIFLNAKKR